MLIKIYDTSRTLQQPISAIESCKVIEEINALTTLEFTINSKAPGADGLQLEYYLITAWGEFVIKEIKMDNDGVLTVYAIYNVEELKQTAVTAWHPSSLNRFIELGGYTNSIYSWTGKNWAFSIERTGTKAARSLGIESNGNVFEHINEICENIGVEWEIDNKARTVKFYANDTGRGENRGAYFFEGLNISQFEIDSNSNDVITCVCPIGADGLMLDGGSYWGKWVTNTTYFSKRVPAFVEFSDIDNEADLRAAAEAYLENTYKVTKSYSMTVADLKALGVQYGDLFEFSIGDTVAFGSRGVKLSHRVVKIERDAFNPEQTKIELSTKTPSLVYSDANRRRTLAKVKNQAAAAAETAEAAQATAESAAQIVYANEAPTAANYNEGATWYKTDTSGNVEEVYVKGAETWEQTNYNSGTLDMDSVQNAIVRIGDESGEHITLDSDSIDFLNNTAVLASIYKTSNATWIVSGGGLVTMADYTQNNKDVRGYTTYSADATAAVSELVSSYGDTSSGSGTSAAVEVTANGTASAVNLRADSVTVNGDPIGGSSACSAKGSGSASTTASAGTTATLVTLATFETINDNSAFEISGGGVKCLKAGTVLVNASVYIKCGTSSTSAGSNGCYVFVNGAETFGNYSYSSAMQTTKCCTKLITVAAGDVITLRARANAAGYVYPANKDTHLDIMYI